MLRRTFLMLMAFALITGGLSSCWDGSTPPPPPTQTPVPGRAEEVAEAFLAAWERNDYELMYGLLTPSSQATITRDSLMHTYQAVAAEATITRVQAQLRAALQEGEQAHVAYAVTMDTALFGPLNVENEMTLRYEDGRWGVDWSPQLIFRELTAGNLVHLTPRAPPRANIYDRNGLGLAVAGTMVTVGVVPGQIEDEGNLLAELSRVLGSDPAAIQAKYAGARADWFVPIADISGEQSQAHYATLSAIPGVAFREKSVRVYNEGGIAPHAVGYLGAIPAEELSDWQALGYSGDELVGRSGLERWGEPYLAGERGGTLSVVTPQGEVVAVLKDRPAAASRSVYSTLDREFQRQVENLLGQRTGAVVVMDPRNGQVLALASYPRFDPNLFVGGISDDSWQALINDSGRPLINRAIQGTYPPGSVFKIVTLAAAMEGLGLTRQFTFNCTGLWTGLGPEWTKPCWLSTGHGVIDPVAALTASCDYSFYEMGLLLDGMNQLLLPDYARAFGLGDLSGLEGFAESPGLVPDNDWKLQTLGEGWASGDSVNLSIGQGYLLVTPLQVARLTAAVANGGILYRPQLALKVAAGPDSPELIVEPEVMGHLPISENTLAAIQEGLAGVTTSRRGTATDVFVGFPISVAGKTGTAQVAELESEQQGTEPHSWFAAYAPVDDPQVVVVAIVEHAGEGSRTAAPLVRQVLAAYFGIEDIPAGVQGPGD
jgi:penicillin-binding protein 2